MNRPVLLDSGYLVALLDRSETHHRQCAETIRNLHRQLITCEAVITESCYLLRKIEGTHGAIMANIERFVIHLPWTLLGNEKRISKLMTQYQDVPMDLADACLVSMAEQFKTPDILSLDKDFQIYRWGRKQTFQML